MGDSTSGYDPNGGFVFDDLQATKQPYQTMLDNIRLAVRYGKFHGLHSETQNPDAPDDGFRLFAKDNGTFAHPVPTLIFADGQTADLSTSQATGVVSITDFGAIGDGDPANAAVNKAAIEAAVDYVVSNLDLFPSGGTIFTPPGLYICRALDLTKLNQHFAGSIRFLGAGMFASVWEQVLGGPGATGNFVDLSGSNYTEWQEMGFQTGVFSDSCFFLARLVDSPNCNGHRFTNCSFFGAVTGDPTTGGAGLIYDYAGENNYWENCIIEHHGGGQGGIVFTATNCVQVLHPLTTYGTSAYGTVVTGKWSQIDDHVLATTIRTTGALVGGGRCVVIEGGSSVYFDQSATYDAGQIGGMEHFHFALNVDVVGTDCLPCSITNHLFEGTGACFFFESSGVGIGPYQALKVTDCWATLPGKWIDIESDEIIVTGLEWRNNTYSTQGAATKEMKFSVLLRSIIDSPDSTTAITIRTDAAGCNFNVWTDSITWTLTEAVGNLSNIINYLAPTDDVAGVSTGLCKTSFGPGAVPQFFPKTADFSGAQLDKISGGIALADGETWNPKATHATDPYFVWRNGGSWLFLGDGQRLQGTDPWNPPSLAVGEGASHSVTVPGARVGQPADAAFSIALPDGFLLTADVISDNTVRCKLFNAYGATTDVAAGTLTAQCWVAK